MHLHFQHAVAFAGLAAAAFDVEAEAAGAVPARARILRTGDQYAARREPSGVGGRFGARRAAVRALIDVDDLVELLEADDVLARRGFLAAAVDGDRGVAVERIVQQRRLARARHAGDAGHEAEGNVDVDAFEIVAAGAADQQLAFGVVGCALPGHGDGELAGEIFAGERGGIVHHHRRRALRHHAAAVHAGARPHVHYIIGGTDRVLVVFDHDHGVAEAAQVFERVEQALIVALVQADRRLVELVHHAHQAGADLARKTNALRLAARQSVVTAKARELVETDDE